MKIFFNFIPCGLPYKPGKNLQFLKVALFHKLNPTLIKNNFEIKMKGCSLKKIV